MAFIYIGFITLDIKNKKAHNVLLTLQAIAWIIAIVLDPYELKN
jgi:hypothetical protein